MEIPDYMKILIAQIFAILMLWLGVKYKINEEVKAINQKLSIKSYHLIRYLNLLQMYTDEDLNPEIAKNIESVLTPALNCYREILSDILSSKSRIAYENNEQKNFSVLTSSIEHTHINLILVEYQTLPEANVDLVNNLQSELAIFVLFLVKYHKVILDESYIDSCAYLSDEKKDVLKTPGNKLKFE